MYSGERLFISLCLFFHTHFYINPKALVPYVILSLFVVPSCSQIREEPRSITGMKQQILEILTIDFDTLVLCINKELLATNVATSSILITIIPFILFGMWLLKAAHGTPDMHTSFLSLSFYCVKSFSLSR
jgi:hypothetical protein